jgi:hypothetical protein
MGASRFSAGPLDMPMAVVTDPSRRVKEST